MDSGWFQTIWPGRLLTKMMLMPKDNKEILLKGNAAISAGDYEGFLELCTEDTVWEFVGDRVLRGKQQVREYMASVYVEPPRFDVSELIAEGEFVVAVGEIQLLEKGIWNSYDYCDVWRFENGLMACLRGFVVPKK